MCGGYCSFMYSASTSFQKGELGGATAGSPTLRTKRKPWVGT